MASDRMLFDEINHHLLTDEQPSLYLTGLKKTGFGSEFPLSMLTNLIKTEQSAIHHPEGNVWNHTMMVTDQAAKVKHQSSNERVFMWAALLHDVGKHATTRNRKGKITSYDHDKVGAELAGEFLRHFGEEENFIHEVTALVRWHMQFLFVVKSMPFAEVANMKRQTNTDDVALLGLCDRLGRTGAEEAQEQKNKELFLKKLSRQTADKF